LHRRQLDACRDRHDLDPVGPLEAQARPLDRLDVRCPTIKVTAWPAWASAAPK
jgi:hypothetical protein